MKLTKRLLAALLVLVLALTMVMPATAAEENVPGASADLLANRVVGYLPSYRMGVVDSIDFSAVTHVILSFVNYKNNAVSFSFSDADVQKVRSYCDQYGVKLMLALGGWGGFDLGNNPADTAAERTAFINDLMSYVDKYDLDGIDIDIEIQNSEFWSHSYELMSELKARLGDDRLLTTAVSPWFTDSIPNKTYECYDFINLMTYDYSNSNVAPMSQVYDQLAYYSQRGVPNDKMTIGVPFYGYDANHEAYTYDEIIRMGVEANEMDFYNGISYNGEATIREKAEMSKDYGGIMIWELGQDNFGDYSLLADIKDVMLEEGVSTSIAPVTNLVAEATSTTMVDLTWTASADAAYYEVYQGNDLLGRTSSTSYTAVNLSPRTDYTFKVAAVGADGSMSKKVSATATTPAGSAGDYEEWSSSIAYQKDAYVTYNGKVYRAKWYSQNEIPGSSDWIAWEYVGDVAASGDESIVVSTDAITLKVGETTTISAGTVPSGTSYTWSTSDASVATIVNGTITAVKAGTAVITATTASGKKDSCTVTVVDETTVDPEPPVEEETTQYIVFKVGQLKAYSSYLGYGFDTDAETVVVDGKAFVPMRYSTLLLEANCNYDATTKKISIAFSDYTVDCGIDSTTATLTNSLGSGNMTLPSDQTPRIINGKTYLPARVLSQFASLTGKYTISYFDNAASGNLGHFVVYVKGTATDAELLATVQAANKAIVG